MTASGGPSGEAELKYSVGPAVDWRASVPSSRRVLIRPHTHTIPDAAAPRGLAAPTPRAPALYLSGEPAGQGRRRSSRVSLGRHGGRAARAVGTACPAH